jgi:drug/metabolite transporter (DMT)-like permease
MNLQLVFWIFAYCFCNAGSILLLGDRNLIKGNLLSAEVLFKIIFHWKFITAMTLAIFARICFVLINSQLLKYPKHQVASTTLTTFISLLSLVFIVIANYLFLGETLSIKQIIGATILIIGLGILLA